MEVMGGDLSLRHTHNEKKLTTLYTAPQYAKMTHIAYTMTSAAITTRAWFPEGEPLKSHALMPAYTIIAM